MNNEFMHDEISIAEHMPLLERMAARAGIILEIGCGHGNGSTRAFTCGLAAGDGNRERLLITVDEAEEKPEVRPEFDWWRKITGDSREGYTFRMVQEILEDRVPEIIFIDTEHTKEQLEKELEVWSAVADSSVTTWIFHDTWQFGQDEAGYNPMTDAIKEFCAEHPEWKFVDLTRKSFGLGLMIGSGRQIAEVL